MDYLKLCKELCREAGIPANGLSDVTGLNGEYERVCAWVAQAWDELQLAREDWWFMRNGFSLSTEAGDNSYLAADCLTPVLDLGEWVTDSLKIYKASQGKAFEGRLPFVEYAKWDATYNVGIQTQGQPTRFTVRPDMSLGFDCTPDSAYIISGDYARSATPLVLKTDTPALPAQFHMAIVYLALQKYGAYEAAAETFAYGKDRYDYYLARIERNQISPITFGGPLA